MDKGHVAGYRQRATTSRWSRSPTSRPSGAPWRSGSGRRRASTTTHRALLAAEAGRLDFVDIATPPSDHATVAHAALDAGLHVLCEKPLAATIDDARAMLRHATRAERVIYPCHNYKHAPVIKAVRGVIESGRIGKVHLVTLQTFRNTHAKGVPGWRTDWRRERRYLGRRHRDGPRQPHLLPGVRVAARLPDGDHARAGDDGPVRHRGRLLLQPALPDRCRVGAPVVERGRAQGDLHAARRARRDPGRGRRHRGRGPRAHAGQRDGRRPVLAFRARGDHRPTGWTRATSPGSTRCSTISRAPSSAASSSAGRPKRRSCACS